MPVDITAHPNYTKEATEYQAALSQATQDGDPAAIERVKADWERKRGSLMGDLYERQDQERTRQATLTTIKAEFPDVPEDVYTHVADPEQARSIAKTVQDKLNAAKGPGEGSWSPSPGGGNPQSSAPPSYAEMSPQERSDLRNRLINEHGKEAGIERYEEIRQASLAPLSTKIYDGTATRQDLEEIKRRSLLEITDRMIGGRRSR